MDVSVDRLSSWKKIVQSERDFPKLKLSQRKQQLSGKVKIIHYFHRQKLKIAFSPAFSGLLNIC